MTAAAVMPRWTRPPVPSASLVAGRCAHRTSARTPPLGSAGSALVEALAALTLMAVAGSVVAAAAAANLRATRQAAQIESLIALAASELAVAQARGAPVATDEGLIALPGVRRQLVVTHDPSGIAALEVRLTAPGTRPLQLSTRMLLPE